MIDAQIFIGRFQILILFSVLDADKEWELHESELRSSAWIWCIFFAFSIPQLLTWFKAFRVVMFKTTQEVLFTDYLVVMLFKISSTIGFVLLFFEVMPELDSVRAAMISNAFCIVPSLLSK